MNSDTVSPTRLRPERIRSLKVASILGVEVRTVQSLAARGELPGAVKIGKLWTFDEAAIREWLKAHAIQPATVRNKYKRQEGEFIPLQVARSIKAAEEALLRLRRNGRGR